MKKSIEKNELVIAGVVAGVLKTPKVAKITISTSPRETRNMRDYPDVVFFGNLLKECNDVKVGDHIEVTCAMMTVPKRMERNGSTSYLVGSSIKKQASALEEATNIEGIGKKFNDKNSAILIGNVVTTYVAKTTNPKVAIVTVKANANGRLSFPKASLFGGLADYVEKKVTKGDKVAIVGHIQTKHNKKDGRYYETIVAKEIKLIPKEEE